MCPAAEKGGIIPHEIMKAGDGDVSTCIMCGNCSRVCKKTDPVTVMKMLRYLSNNGDFGGFYDRTGFNLPMLDHPSRSLELEWTGDDVTVMSGCVITCKVPFLTYATSYALKSMGIKASPLEGEKCCLRPPAFAYLSNDEKKIKRREMVGKCREMLCLCPGCAHEMACAKEKERGGVDFLYKHIDKLPRTNRPLKLALEPGCELADKRDRMSAVVRAMGYEDIGNDIGCCGKDSKVAPALMADRENECRGADAIVVACPKCFTIYDSYEDGIPVIYLFELVAYTFGDSTTLQYHNLPATKF